MNEKAKVDLEELISFLEDVISKEDVIRNPYEVCMDCKEVVKVFSKKNIHKGHEVVLQDIDHSGVTEWLRCLRWLCRHQSKTEV